MKTTIHFLVALFIGAALTLVPASADAAKGGKGKKKGIALRVAALEALVAAQADLIASLQTQIDSVPTGPHTVDTTRSDAEILGVVSGAGYVTGDHTVDTDTQRTDAEIVSAVGAAGFIAGPHTVDTDTQRTDAEIVSAVGAAGFIDGPHTTDTQRTDTEILGVVSGAGYVIGPHTTGGGSVLDPYVSVDANDNIYFTGANVHIRNGTDSTDGAVNGLGNLIVGYNEADTFPTDDSLFRGGSHNLVVGRSHRYTSFGGFVAGRDNNVTGQESSVTGGVSNTASASYSSVSGGLVNTASGFYSSVSGGSRNEASGSISSVSGGRLNTASGGYSSVSGGSFNTASGEDSSVSGGGGNFFYEGNTASGQESSVSGGSGREVSASSGWGANGGVFDDF